MDGSRITLPRHLNGSGDPVEDQGMTPPDHHQHTPDEERRIRDAALDETLAETFPASDPLSSDPNPDDDTVLDRADAGDRGDGRQAVASRPEDIALLFARS